MSRARADDGSAWVRRGAALCPTRHAVAAGLSAMARTRQTHSQRGRASVQHRHARQWVSRPAVERCDDKGTVRCGSEAAARCGSQAAGAAWVQQVSRTGQGSDRRSGDGRARLERLSHSTGATADTDRSRVLHDFWRACFLDFTVALWPVQVTSPKLALRTTTFIQALSGFEQLTGKNRGLNVGLCSVEREAWSKPLNVDQNSLAPPRC